MKQQELLKFISEAQTLLSEATPEQKEKYYQLLLKAKHTIQENKKPKILAENADFLEET